MNELKNNREKAEILTEFLHSHGFGNIVLHSEIETEIDCDKDSGQYGAVISKTKKLLLEKHHMALQNVRGQGYKIVSPDDFTDYALGYYKRGIGTINKGKKHLENAPVEHMSKDAIDVYRRVNDRAITLEAAMRGASVELKTLARKPHPLAVTNN